MTCVRSHSFDATQRVWTAALQAQQQDAAVLVCREDSWTDITLSHLLDSCILLRAYERRNVEGTRKPHLARPVFSVEVADHALLALHLCKEPPLAKDLLVLAVAFPGPLLLLGSSSLHLVKPPLPHGFQIVWIHIVQGLQGIVELVLHILDRLLQQEVLGRQHPE